MSSQAGGSGLQAWEKEDPAILLQRMNLKDDESDNLIWEDEADDPEEAPKWLALARLLTTKGFSQSALMADIESSVESGEGGNLEKNRGEPFLHTIPVLG